MSEASNPWVSRPVTAPPTVIAPTTITPAFGSTGATAPQRGVPAPDSADQLWTVRQPQAAPLWWIGCHGGAGESSLARLVPQWRAAGHLAARRLVGRTVPGRAGRTVERVRSTSCTVRRHAVGCRPGPARRCRGPRDRRRRPRTPAQALEGIGRPRQRGSTAHLEDPLDRRMAPRRTARPSQRSARRAAPDDDPPLCSLQAPSAPPLGKGPP